MTISVKVRAADVPVIDAARGNVSRSTFGREAMLSAARGEVPAQAKPVRQRREGAAGLVSSLPAAAQPAQASEPCKHPKSRVMKGQCRLCFAYVGKP